MLGGPSLEDWVTGELTTGTDMPGDTPGTREPCPSTACALDLSLVPGLCQPSRLPQSPPKD